MIHFFGKRKDLEMITVDKGISESGGIEDVCLSGGGKQSFI